MTFSELFSWLCDVSEGLSITGVPGVAECLDDVLSCKFCSAFGVFLGLLRQLRLGVGVCGVLGGAYEDSVWADLVAARHRGLARH